MLSAAALQQSCSYSAAQAISPLTAVLCALGLLIWVPWALNRWRFRHIPGPWAPPVLGNLLRLAQHDLHGYLELCRKRHGTLFKIYIGSNMIVCLAEPGLARRTFSKLSCRHSGVQLVAGPQDWDFLVDGLVGANGTAWRTLRTAWQPAFGSAALEGYAGGMNAAAEELRQKLEVAAASGEGVELFGELGAMTMDVVGQAAYGVDLHSLQTPEHVTQQQQQQQEESSLLAAIKAVFEGGGVANSSNYLPLVLLFPLLAPLVQALAYRWPDAKLARLAKARAKIRQVSMQLVQGWRGHPQQQQQQQQQDAQSAGNGCITPAGGVPEPAAGALSGTAGAPGTFPGLMLAARDKETGQQLTDEQVVSQLNTFLVAAFETTASAIACCIYFIAQHPQVQGALLAEVDAFGRQRRVAFSDLDQFPQADAILKETLRLIPPGAIAARFTEQGHQLTPEVWLPPGTPLFACIHAYQRDPQLWPAAEQFRPERWLQDGASAAAEVLQPSTPDAYSPFGIGGRLCVGMRFANQEVVIALVRLYQCFTFELKPGQVPLPVKQTFALIPAQGLRVRVQKRS
ncbi:hypothetical protein OEZ86_012145 [Tetradesmus obliquus]|nr:hypothetical protein OEZ86_012145 [Tetradesmus obliquus]